MMVLNMPETRMTSFLNRMKMTNEFTEALTSFLQQHNFRICGFGYEVFFREKPSMSALIKKEKFKKSPAALMVKFSPDLLCAYPASKGEKGIFLLDAKTSITPVFFGRHIERLRRLARLPELRREDIGEIEREAWDVYNRFYPKERVAIAMACPYQPKLVVAEWVSQIFQFFRLKRDRNLEAGGSGTPHVNIHLGKMRALDKFLSQEFRIRVDERLFNDMKDKVKTWELSKPAGTVNWTQFNNVITDLKGSCPWLKHRWPGRDESSTKLSQFTSGHTELSH
jgi:hypothetical protein